jgi:hypothetical protein
VPRSAPDADSARTAATQASALPVCSVSMNALTVCSVAAPRETSRCALPAPGGRYNSVSDRRPYSPATGSGRR